MSFTGEMKANDELAAQLYYSLTPAIQEMGLDPDTDYSAGRFAISESSIPKEGKAARLARLCNACGRMTLKNLHSEQGYKISDSLGDLMRSASTCAVCDMVVKEMQASLQRGRPFGLSRMSLVDLLKEFQSVLAEKSFFLSGKLPIYLQMRRGGYEHYQHHSLGPSRGKRVNIKTIVMHRPTRRISMITAFGYLVLHLDSDDSQRPLRPRGSPEKTIMRLREWLSKRKIGLSSERGPEAGRPLPTRVLDLGRADGDVSEFLESSLHLIETRGQHGRYVALSYCWGGFTGFRTLTGNYQERLNNIDLKELPPVFAQAVRLTRALNIRYLWIDAVCIIQDDSEDWTREAAKMSDIYWYTACRFAVTSSRSPLEGFWPPRRITTSVLVPNLRDASKFGDKDSNSQLYLTLPKFYVDDVDKNHLNTRGWVLQERLLAPCTIHFTRDQIYCEDESDICGEDWVRRHFTWLSCIDKLSQNSPIDLFSRRQEIPDEIESYFPKEEYHIVPHPWLKIPEIFSRCHLTYQTDRLTAVAGLVHRKQTDEYRDVKNFLGLWANNLHVELAWVAATVSSKCAGIKHIRRLGLPSWTWIAYDGPIDFVQDRRSRRDNRTVQSSPTQAFELLSAHVPDLMTPLPLTTPAHLEVDMRLRKIPTLSSELLPYSNGSETRDKVARSSPFRFPPNNHTVPIAMSELTQAREFYTELGNVAGHFSFDDPDEDTHDLYCAELSVLRDVQHLVPSEKAVSRIIHTTKVDQDYILSYAMVLRKVSAAAEDISYRRVGLAQVDYLWMREANKTIIKLV
ncbi:MAG: hypothetical protein Q9227_003800 [Pyrenula ochraceoflavens]